jgi:hypothetical protein
LAGTRVAGAASQARKKLAYLEQREYDGMETAIHKAEAEAAKAEAVLNDPAVRM